MNNKKKSHQPHPLKGKLIFSGILILLGVVLLGFNFGIISPLLKPVIFSWQMLVIALGVITLLSRNIFSGLFTILVGGFFLLPALHRACPDCLPWVTNDFVGIYYPVLLIAAGVLFFIYWLLPAKCKSYFVHLHSNVGHQCTCGENCTCEKCRCKDNNCNHSHSKHSPNGNKCNCTLDKNVVFASSEEIYLDEEFTG
ncbi:MAG: hypothetical protein LBV31_00265, partial [Prevotellaceae bacterium]|nr:hypothetical protein [Prevotellaceae bacterium]